MNRPRVIVYALASLDGRLTLAPDVLLLYGDERWEAVAGTSDAYERLKATFQPEATLEGSGSFVLEGQTPDPLPPFAGDAETLYQDFLPEAVVHRPGARGWFAAVDGRGRVRGWVKEWPGEEWAGWHLLVWVSRQTPPAYLDYLRRETIPYLVTGEARVDLGGALAKTKSLLGVDRLLSTAGGQLNGALVRAGLVDEVHVELFPAIIGGPATPALFDAPALQPGEWPTRLQLLAVEEQGGGRVLLRYAVLTE